MKSCDNKEINLINKHEMKDLNYWKNNAEEDYIQTPISVLRYITELEKQAPKKQFFIYGVVKRLRLKYKKWRVMNEIRQLDFDMQCTNMTYKQYEVEYNRLSKQYDNLQ